MACRSSPRDLCIRRGEQRLCSRQVWGGELHQGTARDRGMQQRQCARQASGDGSRGRRGSGREQWGGLHGVEMILSMHPLWLQLLLIRLQMLLLQMLLRLGLGLVEARHPHGSSGRSCPG